MISYHALSAFLLNHPLNGLGNSNLWSVQEVIQASKPATEKFKDICTNFPNLALLTISSTPGEIQITFGHSMVRNKSLGEILQAFALAGDLASPSVISFNLEIAFSPEGEKIRLPIMEGLLCDAPSNLKGTKKQRDWQSLNAVLLLSFLTESAILHGKSDAGELLKIFARAREMLEDIRDGSQNHPNINKRE